MSDFRCVSDCRSRGPGLVPYFLGDWSCNNFYGHFPPFRLFIQEGLLSVKTKSMCTKYWLTDCFKLAQEKMWLGELTSWHDHSCCLGPKATYQTKKTEEICVWSSGSALFANRIYFWIEEWNWTLIIRQPLNSKWICPIDKGGKFHSALIGLFNLSRYFKLSEVYSKTS